MSKTTQTSASQGSGKSITSGKFGVIALVAVVVIAVVVVIFWDQWHYKVQGVEITFQRDSLGAVPDKLVGQATAFGQSRKEMRADELFTDENIQRYYAGNFLTVHFVREFQGREESREDFQIKPWTKYEETDEPVRRAYVDEQQKLFADYVERFKHYQPRTWPPIELYVDDTEGIRPQYRQQITEAFEDLAVRDRLKLGDGFELYFYRLSNTDFRNRRRIFIKQGDGSAAYARVRDGLDWLLENRPAEKETSLATGLFDAMSENAGKNGRHLLIFSDGVENKRRLTVSLYDNPELSEQKNWPQLDQLFQHYVKFPDLRGTTVDWYMPPPARERDEPIVRNMRNYWERTLGQVCGAKVTMH